MKRKLFCSHFFCAKAMLLACLFLLTVPQQAISYNHYGPLINSIAHDQGHVYLATERGLVVMKKPYLEQTVKIRERCDYVTINNGDVWLSLGSRWIGTLEGDDFLSWQHQWSVPSSSGSSEVRKILFSDNGRMYIAAIDGLIVAENDDIVFYYRIPTLVTEGMVTDMDIDSEGCLWIASYDNEQNKTFCRYTKEGRLEYVPAICPCEYKLLPNALAIDSANNVWIATNPLLKFDGTGYTPYLSGKSFVDLCFDGGGKLWGLCRDATLCAYEGDTIAEYAYALGEKEEAQLMDIDGDTVYIATNLRLLVFHDGQFTSMEIISDTDGIRELDTSAARQPMPVDYDLGGRPTGDRHRGVTVSKGRKQR